MMVDDSDGNDQDDGGDNLPDLADLSLHDPTNLGGDGATPNGSTPTNLGDLRAGSTPNGSTPTNLGDLGAGSTPNGSTPTNLRDLGAGSTPNNPREVSNPNGSTPTNPREAPTNLQEVSNPTNASSELAPRSSAPVTTQNPTVMPTLTCIYDYNKLLILVGKEDDFTR
ncbi:hypothetical protein MIMGU_mgv1a015120mg [Erythranthe guttata]|uniref:Uncharacterized protein n=1 Tax=Erythranthe guttata TaxID=4155 RepID=A0A022Q197_ERYGU|nr:hypothetical protein MIMGU_mgv1a015120mg [Erythranthe guttata]